MMQRIDFVIERADKADAEKIAEIEKACFSQPWSENEITKEIIKDNVIFLCAKSDCRVIGYISGQMILDEFYISNIAVSEEFRNNGIASALIRELISKLQLQNCALVTLEVRSTNNTARGLYEYFGFRDLGIRKDFYSHPREDAHIYTLYFKNEV